MDMTTKPSELENKSRKFTSTFALSFDVENHDYSF